VAERLLDVSELAPPEPLERILDAAEELRAGERLRVLHRREPWPLFPMLEDRGFAHRMRALNPPGFEILIWRAGDPAAAGGDC
jgi:uncharacterized protein (DUF2249 family)